MNKTPSPLDSKPERTRPDITSLADFLRGPLEIRSLALIGLFTLALFYTLYFARAFFLPITLAILLNLLLAPIVRRLARIHIPEALGAALLLLALIGIASYTAYRLSGPASDWLATMPESVDRIRWRLQEIKKPVEKLSEATEQVDKLTQGEEDEQTPKVELKEPGLSAGLFDRMQEFFVGAGVMFVLLYFLLASGDLFLRKLVRVLPRLEDKKRAVEIARQMEDDISAYLSTITLINIGLGGAIGLGMFFLGMPNPVLWGIMAGLLNFIPYLGALVGITVVTLVALISFVELGQALLAPAIYFGLNLLEAYLITPLALSRRLTLNPVVLFVWLIFWGWIWGVAGAILAVPMLAVFKIFCDHLEPLTSIGEFLGQ